LEDYTENEEYGEDDSIFESEILSELDRIPELSDDTENEIEGMDDNFEDQEAEELISKEDPEDIDQHDGDIITDDNQFNEKDTVEDYTDDISADDLLETIIDEAGELEEEEYELEGISDDEFSEIEADLMAEEADLDDELSDEEMISGKNRTDQNNNDVPSDFMNNVFHSVFDIFGEDEVELPGIQNADKERISEILSRSMSVLEESLQDLTIKDHDDSIEEVTEIEQNDTEAELDEIELMKQSLGLVDEEEENEQSNLAEAIAKKFVEEAAKPPQDEPIISDDETEDLKDLINQDFEDDNK
jgi:DNA-binding ferritin-like protein